MIFAALCLLIPLVQNTTAIALMSKSFTMQNNNDNNPMTKSGTERNYSLWLLPPLNSSECIQPQIAKLAEKYGGPFFVPHITVVGGIKCKSEQEALEVARNLQEGLAGFGTVTCEFRNTPYSSQGTKWSQALCLATVLSESLLNLCHSSLRIIGRDPDQWTFPSPICAPHLSLFYGTSNIPQTVEVQPVESFQSSVIALWQTEPPTTEGVAKWKEIIRIELEKS